MKIQRCTMPLVGDLFQLTYNGKQVAVCDTYSRAHQLAYIYNLLFWAEEEGPLKTSIEA